MVFSLCHMMKDTKNDIENFLCVQLLQRPCVYLYRTLKNEVITLSSYQALKKNYTSLLL